MKILAAQIDVPAVATAETRQAHLMRIDGLLRSALSETAVDLVVLPELSSVDYARAAFDRGQIHGVRAPPQRQENRRQTAAYKKMLRHFIE